MTKQNGRSASQHMALAIPHVDKIRSRVMAAKVKASRDDVEYKQICKDALKACDKIEDHLDSISAWLIENVPDIASPEDE